MKDQRKGSEAPRLSKVGSVGIPIEQFPERSRASLIKFDANGDGKISTLELAEAASAFKRERGFRKGLTTGVAVMAVLFALLVSSNVATSFLAVSVLKDTYAKEGATPTGTPTLGSADDAPMTPKRLLDHKNHNGKPLLAGRSGNPLASGSTVASLTLSELPLLGQDFDYNSIKSVTLPPVDGVARGYTVQGFAWYNSTDLDLYLSLDRTLHIVGSMIFVSKTSETGMANRRRMPIPFVVAGLIFVGSAVGSAVIGYYVEMGLDAIHGVGDDPDQ